MQAARLTNEINQALGQREVDPQRLLPLILECAAEKYKTCHIKESDHITINIKALFQEHGNDEKLDRGSEVGYRCDGVQFIWRETLSLTCS